MCDYLGSDSRNHVFMRHDGFRTDFPITIAMGRKNPILTFALCASMTAHTALLMAVIWWYIQHTPLPKLAALPRPEEQPAPILVDPPPTNPQQKTQPPPPPPPDDFSNATKEPLRDDSGETKGIGTAN